MAHNLPRDAPQAGHLDLAQVDASGVVRLEMPSGAIYEGAVVDGKPHGRGTMRYENGDVYEGGWANGRRHGTGTFTFADEEQYSGEWVEDKRHGMGTGRWASGAVYVGEWLNGVMHGMTGTYTYANGAEYVGQWKDNLSHGTGTLTYPDGTFDQGEFLNGKLRLGKSTRKYADGTVEEGMWVDWTDGEKHGCGRFEWENGDIYEGDWVDRQMTHGRMTWANGDVEFGRFSGAPPFFYAGAQSIGQPPGVRKLRSQRSQQRRLEKNVATKNCEHCGADDDHYKLRVCSGCNLALYCSAACQKAASRSHRRICQHTPSRVRQR